jgi:hypothetical protein
MASLANMEWLPWRVLLNGGMHGLWVGRRAANHPINVDRLAYGYVGMKWQGVAEGVSNGLDRARSPCTIRLASSARIAAGRQVEGLLGWYECRAVTWYSIEVSHLCRPFE